MGGRILLDDIDLYDASIDVVAVRRAIGMVFQKPNPFPILMDEPCSALDPVATLKIEELERIFTNPQDPRTEEYVTGKFG